MRTRTGRVRDEHRDRDGADRFLRRPAARPGDAGDADATSAPVRSRMPSASATATGSLTAPCAAISASGTPAQRGLALVAVERPRRRARSRSCRAHRSVATSAGRRCTTPPPQSSDHAARSRSPTTCSIGRPSVLNTSRPSAAASSIARVARATCVRAGRDRVPAATDAIRSGPGVARMVVSIGGSSRSPSRIDRLRRFLDVGFAAPGHEQTGPVDTRSSPARSASESARTSASSIGCSSRGGPGSSTTTRAP